MFRPPSRSEVRVLDPGAGTGVLGLAAADALIARHRVRVHLVAVEKEGGALAALREAASHARARHGDALVHIAQHNSHHLGQVVSARQFLELWPPRAGGWTW